MGHSGPYAYRGCHIGYSVGDKLALVVIANAEKHRLSALNKEQEYKGRAKDGNQQPPIGLKHFECFHISQCLGVSMFDFEADDI